MEQENKEENINLKNTDLEKSHDSEKTIDSNNWSIIKSDETIESEISNELEEDAIEEEDIIEKEYAAGFLKNDIGSKEHAAGSLKNDIRSEEYAAGSLKNDIESEEYAAGFLENDIVSEKYAAGFLKNGIGSGIMYQIKVITSVIWKLMCNKNKSINNWQLAAEAVDARGWHDLVLKYNPNTNQNTSTDKCMYRFVQVKHCVCTKYQISSTQFMNMNMKYEHKYQSYSLPYLFKSYLRMLKNKKITSDQIVDLTIFTNKDIYPYPYLVQVKEKDEIFSFEGKGKQYRIDLDSLYKCCPFFTKRLELHTDKEIEAKEFLSKIVFAVDQPSEYALDNRIIEEMGKFFDAPQMFYSDLYRNIINWYLLKNDTTAPYLNETQVVRYLKRTQDILSNMKKTNTISTDDSLPKWMKKFESLSL